MILPSESVIIFLSHSEFLAIGGVTQSENFSGGMASSSMSVG